jgi:hypothetical protein
MQIAGAGAIEISLANLGTGVAAQQQVDQAAIGQNGLRSAGVNEKQEAEQAKAARASADVADLAATPEAAQPGSVDAGEGLTSRQLFDYLAEVERNGSAAATPPSALVGSAIGALDGTLQKISATLEKAQAVQGVDAGESRAQQPASQSGTGQAAAGEGASRADSFASEAEQMLERSMSVMWAAANLEVVMGSVTAVTSSTSTLIKQQ